MKRVTAGEARWNWFRLLDEVAAGATVVIERSGCRILLQRDPAVETDFPDYSAIISVPDAGEADRWGWRMEADERNVVLDADP